MILEISKIEAALPVGWLYVAEEKSIQKEFSLTDFSDAAQFINLIAPLANTLDHHPDLLLHKYNKVKVTLTTHSEGGVTENDIQLAQEINAL
ncbi:MAG: 4a-hydroxytetrahydrobiopterin dehydratase [bacterium]